MSLFRLEKLKGKVIFYFPLTLPLQHIQNRINTVHDRELATVFRSVQVSSTKIIKEY